MSKPKIKIKPAQKYFTKCKADIAEGWGMAVGNGSGPYYVAYIFHGEKAKAQEEIFAEFQHILKVALVPFAEYRRLKRIERECINVWGKDAVIEFCKKQG